MQYSHCMNLSCSSLNSVLHVLHIQPSLFFPFVLSVPFPLLMEFVLFFGGIVNTWKFRNKIADGRLCCHWMDIQIDQSKYSPSVSMLYGQLTYHIKQKFIQQNHRSNLSNLKKKKKICCLDHHAALSAEPEASVYI